MPATDAARLPPRAYRQAGERAEREWRGVRAVVQRVSEATVTVADRQVGAIGRGFVVLLGVARGDGADAAARLAGKVARLRVFENEDGRFDRSLLDVDGAALVVSQFTLITDSRRQKGTRPDFSQAARPEGGGAALRAILRGAPGAWRARANGRLRSSDAGCARQRRAGHDHPRDVTAREALRGASRRKHLGTAR